MLVYKHQHEEHVGKWYHVRPKVDVLFGTKRDDHVVRDRPQLPLLTATSYVCCTLPLPPFRTCSFSGKLWRKAMRSRTMYKAGEMSENALQMTCQMTCRSGQLEERPNVSRPSRWVCQCQVPRLLLATTTNDLVRLNSLSPLCFPIFYTCVPCSSNYIHISLSRARMLSDRQEPRKPRCLHHVALRLCSRAPHSISSMLRTRN